MDRGRNRGVDFLYSADWAGADYIEYGQGIGVGDGLGHFDSGTYPLRGVPMKLLFLLLLAGCAAKPTVCGQIVAMRAYENDLGQVPVGAFIAIETSSGTVVQLNLKGIWKPGMIACGEPL